MKLLLIIMAVVEGAAGLGLLTIPSIFAGQLLGFELGTPGGFLFGRLAGAALISLALACWLGRNSEKNEAAKGIVAAMLVYNEAAAFILIYASVNLGVQGPFIWPLFLLHQALAFSCGIVSGTATKTFAMLSGRR